MNYPLSFIRISIFILTFSTFGTAQEIEQKFQSVLDSIYQSNPESIGIMIHVEAPDRNISWSAAVGISDKKTKPN